MSDQPNYLGDPLTQHFYRINRVIPDVQELKVATVDMRAADALSIMKRWQLSQLPVLQGEHVLGIFSYRSFSLGMLEFEKAKTPPAELPVTEFLEKASFARVTDDFPDVLKVLNTADAVLIGDPNRLQAILTSVDVLDYLYQVSSPLLLVAEVELAIRSLIRRSVPDLDRLRECIQRGLGNVPREKLPATVDDMNFNDYIQLVCNGDNWPLFQEAFGASRDLTRVKLDRIRKIRNDLLHFRGPLTIQQHEQLTAAREWLLIRCTVMQHGC